MQPIGGGVGSDDTPESTDPAEEFWRAVGEDMLSIASHEAGEQVTYMPGGDVLSPRHLRCLVDRQPIYTDGEIGAMRRVVRLDLPGLSVDPDGLSLVEEGVDLVDVPLREGETPTRCLVTRVESHSRGWWSLEAQP